MSYQLSDIISKIRSVTGRLSSDQLTDDQITAYINNYYKYTLPNEIKTTIALQPYSFTTTQGIDIYDFPTSTYYTMQPTAYVDGNVMRWYQDPDLFYNDYPIQVNEQDLSAGDAVTVTFAGTVDTYPIIAGSFIVYDGTETFTDNSDGTLTGDAGGTGTIVYLTGAYSVTFSAAPSSTATVSSKYEPYTGNRPYGLLYYNNEFKLRPVPNDVYNIKMNGYILPTALADATDIPFDLPLAPMIIYGTSLEIFTENGEVEQYANYFPIYQRFIDVALDRTVEESYNERSIPKF